MSSPAVVNEAAEALAERCAAAMWKDDSASQGLGMDLVEVGPGRARLEMAVTKAMLNGHGTCHGGFIFALADSAFAFACNTHGERAVASGCSIAFLRPGKCGDRLAAVAQERARAGRSGIYDVQVLDPAGSVVAEFRGHSRVIGSFEPAAETKPGQ